MREFGRQLRFRLTAAAIVNFILQKEGEPAGGLLPQWSSGTAFLFSTVADVVHAKELSAQIVPAPKIVLGYDSGDSLEQAVAERIAVDAREARVQLTAQAVRPGLENATDARLVRLRMQSKSPALALESFIDTLGGMTKIEEKALPDPASAEDIYNRERAIVSSYRVVPLVWLPRVYGLSARVRDWTPPGPGSRGRWRMFGWMGRWKRRWKKGKSDVSHQIIFDFHAGAGGVGGAGGGGGDGSDAAGV